MRERITAGIVRRVGGRPGRLLRAMGPAVVAASLVLVVVPPASASSAFTAEADSYVEASAPNKNNGRKNQIRTDGSPVVRSYIRFDVQNVTDFSSAALRVYANSNNSVGIQVHAVADDSWGERTITWNNAPAIGPVLASTGAIKGGNWYQLDVSSAVSEPGPVSFALTSTSSTATSLSSREGANPPQLMVPMPTGAGSYEISRIGDSYHAESPTGTTFDGDLKFVVESAVHDLGQTGGGSIVFTAGVFDLGSDHWEFYGLQNISFVGQGIDVTTIQNWSDESSDTEPFDVVGADGVTVSDMTVNAGGPPRTTSDALDFDNGRNVVVERVKVAVSRGRGMIFDGKGDGWDAFGNEIRDCIITGIPSDGIELLATSDTLIQGCTITDVGGHGIQVTKSSAVASQPNKKSNDNVLMDNVIDQAGQDGIDLISGDRNVIDGNLITNSSDDTFGRDGIRITSGDSISCDDNVVRNNTATDTQATKTQKYGLHIASSACNRTVVGPGNDFTGNRVASIQDSGTDTQYL